MLKCNVRGVANGYPLKLVDCTTEVIEVEFDKEMIVTLLGKIDYAALKKAALDLDIPDLEGYGESSVADATGDAEAPSVPAVDMEDEELLKRIHHVLLEVHVMEGSLVCPESGRKFGIKEGIPNMLLHEDEV